MVVLHEVGEERLEALDCEGCEDGYEGCTSDLDEEHVDEVRGGLLVESIQFVEDAEKGEDSEDEEYCTAYSSQDFHARPPVGESAPPEGRAARERTARLSFAIWPDFSLP